MIILEKECFKSCQFTGFYSLHFCHHGLQILWWLMA